MASASFRDSMNSLGWSRRDADEPVNTSQSSPFLNRLQSLNPFGDRGYVRLPTTENPGAPLPAPSRREEEEGWFARKLLCPPSTTRLEDALGLFWAASPGPTVVDRFVAVTTVTAKSSCISPCYPDGRLREWKG
jgi:hypothetical protein